MKKKFYIPLIFILILFIVSLVALSYLSDLYANKVYLIESEGVWTQESLLIGVIVSLVFSLLLLSTSIILIIFGVLDKKKNK